ncbi:MAG: S8 family serine peptidase [Chloracidobacterium sp.]|nr:S8 family serine peptidase [Chloracidobacterium sp.]
MKRILNVRLWIGAFAVAAGAILAILLPSASPTATSGEGNQFEISFPSAKFDPVKTTAAGTVRPGEAPAGNEYRYYIVQLNRPTEDDLLNDLSSLGVEVLQYVPQSAFYVRAKPQAIGSAAAREYVRWAGAFLPEHKISSVLSQQLFAAQAGRAPAGGISPIEFTAPDRAIFDVAVFKTEPLDKVAERLTSVYGATVINRSVLPANYFNMIRAEISLDQIMRVAEIPGVITMDAYSRPQAEDERAAHIVSGNYTGATTISAPGWSSLTQFGRDGSGVTVAVADDGISIPGNGGFYITAANTINGPMRGAPAGATGGHGHINASIIAGDTPFYTSADPAGYNYGVGIARKANIINVPFLVNGYTGTDANNFDDTVSTFGANGVKGSISNNSWGNGTNGNVYDAYTAGFDGFVRDASSAGTVDPINIIFSAGNSGASGLTRPKTAKNVIATGNSENLRTELGGASADSMEDLVNTSSRGPAADGRVKPDIVAPGGYITGGGAGSGASTFGFVPGTSNNILYSSGTSHAAPQVAGAAALFTQAWKENNSGNNPSPALIKAAILNTGQEMTGVNVGTAIPNGNEGWGRINLKYMLRTGVPMRFLEQSGALLAPGWNSNIIGFVGDPTKPIRVALVWTDPAGAPNANPALVNNLDLTVTLGGVTYRGNNFTGGISTAGGTADTINNVEMVRLPAGTATGTPFSINVVATALNGDGVPGNGDPTDQDFALVAYNYATYPSARADFDGDGRTDVSVYRPTGGIWHTQRSFDGYIGQQFGISSDVPVPGDYDGDGRTDLAVFRADANPANPDFFVLKSLTNTVGYAVWGTTGDVPVTGDYDGDHKADYALFRPSNNTWYIQKSLGGSSADSFGSAGDMPLAMDYERDGKSNIGVFRPANATWYIAKPTGVPSQNFYAVPFGISSDKPVPGDYDGDSEDDIAVFRSTSGIWYVLSSLWGPIAVQFGANGDIPVPGDYDGDGRDDPAVFRNGTWYMLRSSAGFAGVAFGLGTDIPVPRKYVP